ncbi:hypothetical protein [Pseudoroseicyclus tamaricis]|uniref:Cytochrome c domain-containing protein n=1 Tax=Pseudoroseicyclus tamaricis TaxID=2705421 RepID=A0A6B2JHQ4_9RHOB|nr:hypothetical protein [Pseudoroseicyclus tamaricis]NDV00851.1 hypothetical protein [Pseudoroseicyclus tamaricis]
MALWYRLTLLLAAVAFAAASLGAAERMAPEDPALAAYVAAGGDLADICGDVSGGHASHCPICHGLPDAPGCRFDPAERRVALLPLWPGAMAELGLAPQRGHPNLSARAPPARA